MADLPAEKGRKGAMLYESTVALPMLYICPTESDNLDLTAERARLAHFQANKTELEAAKMKRELIEVEEVAEIVGNDYANMRANLLSLPTKLAPQLVGIEDIAQGQALIEQGVYSALQELSADEVYSAPRIV
ncbi:MAG: hypothetical protein H6985_14325 [Pseudomonadales bacterium]|nr:hypothetical protein [Pseudomonadales bacterium]